MTYCLQTEDGKVRIEIRCSLADRPETMADLVIGIRNGTIQMIKPQKLRKRLQELKNIEFHTDWERTGTQARYINWIPTENL
jgi:hypothetical protein